MEFLYGSTILFFLTLKQNVALICVDLKIFIDPWLTNKKCHQENLRLIDFENDRLVFQTFGRMTDCVLIQT